MFILNKDSIFVSIFHEISNLFGKFFSVLVGDIFGILPITYSFFLGGDSLRIIDIVTPAIVVLFIFLSMGYYRSVDDSPSSWLYTILVFVGCVGLYSSNTLMEFTIFWVILNVSIYGLILKNMLNGYSVETVVKYFLLGAVTTSVLFFGLFLNFAVYQTLDYSDISFLIETSILVSGGSWTWSVAKSGAFLCVFVAFLFKLGAYPFHFYLPTVYEGIDYRTLGVITIPVKWFTFIAMIKFVSVYGSVAVTLYSFFLVIGFGSLFFGSYGLFIQNRLRSFWAFSYLGSLGFTFLGVSVCSLSLVWGASLFYFFVYLITWGIIYYVLGIFVVGSDSFAICAKRIHAEPRYLSDFSRLAGYGDFAKFRVLFCTCLFSMAGVPPAVGFIAKLTILSSLAQTSFGFIFLIFTVVTMIMSAVGYLRLVSAVVIFADQVIDSSAVKDCGQIAILGDGSARWFDLLAAVVGFIGLVIFWL